MIINIKPLWEKQRDNVINYLKINYEEITIHKIKFSNKFHQEEVKIFSLFITLLLKKEKKC